MIPVGCGPLEDDLADCPSDGDWLDGSDDWGEELSTIITPLIWTLQKPVLIQYHMLSSRVKQQSTSSQIDLKVVFLRTLARERASLSC